MKPTENEIKRARRRMQKYLTLLKRMVKEDAE